MISLLKNARNPYTKQIRRMQTANQTKELIPETPITAPPTLHHQPKNIFIPFTTLPFAQQQPTGEKFQIKGVHATAMINTKSIQPKKGVIVVYLPLAPSTTPILPVVTVIHTTDHCISSNYHDVVRVMGRGTATGTNTHTHTHIHINAHASSQHPCGPLATGTIMRALI